MRAVLIGLGMVADMHAAALKDASNASLYGVCTRRSDVAKEFAERHGVPKQYSSVEEVAADPDVDFAIVLTPPDARKSIVQTLAEAGKPILLEKPIERTHAAAKAIVEICAKADVPLGVCLQHRMRPPAMHLKSLLDTGALGQMGSVEVTIPWWRAQSYYDEPGRGTYARDGGGVLITQAIHILDLMVHLCGPVAALQAMTATTALHQMEAEDFAAAALQFANGAIGGAIASTGSFPGGGERIAINGTLGSADLSRGAVTLHWQNGETETIGTETASGGGANPMAFSHGAHQAVIEDFAACLIEDRPPGITGQDALHVQAVIDAVQASSRTGTRVTVTDA